MTEMKKFANLSIHIKFSIFFGTLIVLVLATYSLITFSNNQLRSSGGSLEIARRNQNLALQMGYLASNIANGRSELKPELAQVMFEFEEYLQLSGQGGPVVIHETEVVLPANPEELQAEFSKISQQWLQLKPALELLGNATPTEELRAQAYQQVLQHTPALYQSAKSYSESFVRRYIRVQTSIQIIILVLSALNLAGLFIGAYLLRRYITRPMRKLVTAAKGLANGDLSFQVKAASTDEVGQLTMGLTSLKNSIEETTQFVDQIGLGNFHTQFQAKSEQDKLSLALLGMRDNLQQIAEEDRRRNWANEGMAHFSELLRQPYSSVADMADNIVSQLVKYVNASQGSFFSLEKEEEGSHQQLKLLAAYAFNRKKFLHKTFEIGEGLVGQVVLEKEVVYLTDVPQNYISIKSGLGSANPTTILIVPLLINEEVYGVLELASFKSFATYQIEFIKLLSQSIASSLSNAYTSERTHKLLESSQLMTRMMQEQEEEMRQNLEELQATQEDMERSHREMEEKEYRFNQLCDTLEGMLFQLYTEEGTQKRRFSFISPGILNLLGYTAEEGMQAPEIGQVLKPHPEDAAALQECIDRSRQQLQKNIIWEGRLLTRGGQPRWVSLRTKAERQQDGAVLWSGLILDATELHKREEELKTAMLQMKEQEQVMQEMLQEYSSVQEELHKKQQDLESSLNTLQTEQRQKQKEVEGIAQQADLSEAQTDTAASPAV